jgi:biotin carboxylase
MTTAILVMRKGCKNHPDHIARIRDLGIGIVGVTGDRSLLADRRFRHVEVLPDSDAQSKLRNVVEIARTHGADFAITFQETDIILAAGVNAALGRETVPVEAAKTCRSKAAQRALFADANLPTVGFRSVGSLAAGRDAAEALGYPVILKPTSAASSVNVSLVRTPDELTYELTRIQELSAKGQGFYFDDNDRDFAILEEYLPGIEVTVDGVVVDGVFHLGGIHNKLHVEGPYFEEDFYTLPYSEPECEADLADLAARICVALSLQNTLFNVECRRDRAGVFKIVECSCRVSGGSVYKNIRDVYGIDMVGAHMAALVPALSDRRDEFLARSAPAKATCIKFIYGSGMLVSNNVGVAVNHSAFRAYFPFPKAGSIVKRAPDGFDIIGVLSVATTQGDCSVDAVEKLALEVADQLDVVLR